MTARASALFPEDHAYIVQQPMVAAAPERLFPFSNHQSIAELELDAFQVALVPFQKAQTGAGGNRARDWSSGQILLLPMSLRDLVDHLRKEMDVPRSTHESSVVRFGDVVVDLASMEVRRSNRLLQMTKLEFKVLRFFVLNPNRVISREELLDQVWGYENYPCTRTVDNHILKLRQKLEPDFANPLHFRTVHGTGYRFTP